MTAPKGFRKVADGVYEGVRVVHMPKLNPMTRTPYEAAFKATIRRIAGDGWALRLEHVTDKSDVIAPSEHPTLNAAAHAAEMEGWT